MDKVFEKQAEEWFERGRHDIETAQLHTLLNHISTFDKSFEHFIDLCEKASRYYVEDRYPPGPPVEYGYEEVKEDLDNAWDLINRIRAKT